jgi:hypothetical protein
MRSQGRSLASRLSGRAYSQRAGRARGLAQESPAIRATDRGSLAGALQAPRFKGASHCLLGRTSVWRCHTWFTLAPDLARSRAPALEGVRPTG